MPISFNSIQSIIIEKLPYIEAIIDIFKFHDQVSATGFHPDETAAQMMCKEFYKCKKPKASSDL